MRKIIENQSFDQERALYGISDTTVRHCSFIGPADGESALKETRNIDVDRCSFHLRYPLWHVSTFTVSNSEFGEPSRASAWYSSDGSFAECTVRSVKFLRECHHILLDNMTIVSPEFGWRCDGLTVKNCSIESEYPFFESKGVHATDLKMKGKYSFQYCESVSLQNSELETKDTFWHAKNCTLENCTINGEYFGWYSEGLTLINCKVVGTQPFCYCRNLTLKDCILEKADLAFEYSDVRATIHSHVDSIKNPLSGEIRVDSVGQLIREDAVKECHCSIITKP